MPKHREWWLGAELNRRHKDFQSSALPTELPSQTIESIAFNEVFQASIFALHPSIVSLIVFLS